MLGFFQSGQLKKIPADGGAALSLCAVENAKGGAWGPDDVILFTPRWDRPIYRVSAAGGEAVAVTSLDVDASETGHRFPEFLPDGKRFLYVVRGTAAAGQPAAIVRLGSLDGGETQDVLRSDSQARIATGHLLYTVGNTLLARPFDPKSGRPTADAFPVAEKLERSSGATCSIFSVSKDGKLLYQVDTEESAIQLYWVSRSGELTEPVGEPAVLGGATLSPDGSLVALEDWSNDETSDLWLLDVASGARHRFTF